MANITRAVDALQLRVIVPPINPRPRTASAVAMENEIEKQNSSLRQCFDRVMCKELGVPDRYQSVAVLIVRWAQHLDEDLGCHEEVEELDLLFRDSFGYKTKIVVLSNKKRPQTQLDRAITEFIDDHDGPARSHLLMVYYTGHGLVKTANGVKELIISGKQSIEKPEEGTYHPNAEWDQAESSLKKTEADVLVILDCCFACSVMKGMTEHTRSFELLAATGKDSTTPKPGPRSYTRAFIDSLKAQLCSNQSQPFTTFDLNQEITRRRDWSDQPILANRTDSATRHIVLAPLDSTQPSTVPTPIMHAGHLNLRLVFTDTCLSDNQVETLAEYLASAAKRSKLGISAIDWMGFVPRGWKFAQLVGTAHTFSRAQTRFRTKKRKRESEALRNGVVSLVRRQTAPCLSNHNGRRPRKSLSYPYPLTPPGSSGDDMC